MSDTLERVTAAEPVGGYRLWLRFASGAEGVLNLEPELWGEVFEPLRDPAVFATARLDPELGTVVWPNGADIAPEHLLHLLDTAPAPGTDAKASR